MVSVWCGCVWGRGEINVNAPAIVCSTIIWANLFLCLAERQVIHTRPLAEELHRKKIHRIVRVEWHQDCTLSAILC